ncbi:MAG: hypothetical protein CBARDCOR_3510 [uncultured Caballeronia sp.]|nr:MAG: hypothetical protein CBARDCOR_3510 [uncultured Caballeronia sp.]
MDTGFQHFTHCCYCHESSPRGLGLKPAAASDAPCFSIKFPGSGTLDTLGAPACDSSPILLHAFCTGFPKKRFQKHRIEKTALKRRKLLDASLISKYITLKWHDSRCPLIRTRSQEASDFLQPSRRGPRPALQSVNSCANCPKTAAPARARVRRGL